MLCPRCGKEVAEDDPLCGLCGSALSRDKPSSGESPPNASVAAPPGSHDQLPPRSGKAIASLVLGLSPFVFAGVWLLAGVFGKAGLTLFLALLCLLPVVSLLAIIFGHRATASIRQSGGRLRGERIATGGLVAGYLGLASVLLVFVTLLLLPPFVEHSRMAANQASAVGSLRTINDAAKTYAQTYKRGYPPALADLGTPNAESSNAGVEPSEKAAGLIDDVLALGRKSNYRFTYIPGPTDGAGKIQSYAIHADPAEPGVSGKMHYFTDQSGVIRAQNGKEADENNPSLAASGA